LANNIQTVFARGRALSLLAFIVKVGFDSILPDCILSRLASEGWSAPSINWVPPVLRGRNAQLRVDSSRSLAIETAGSPPPGPPCLANPLQALPTAAFCYVFARNTCPSNVCGQWQLDKLSAGSRSPGKNCKLLSFVLVSNGALMIVSHLTRAKLATVHLMRSTKALNPFSDGSFILQ
jgi:hypothetical protein